MPYKKIIKYLTLKVKYFELKELKKDIEDESIKDLTDDEIHNWTKRWNLSREQFKNIIKKLESFEDKNKTITKTIKKLIRSKKWSLTKEKDSYQKLQED